MPFRYKNILRLHGDKRKVSTALKAVLSNSCIDFTKITPPPPWAKKGWIFEQGKETCLSTWSRENWGVYQNAAPPDADEPYYSPDMAVFYTVGANVPSLMSKLSVMFPDLTLDYLWASEEIGMYTGLLRLQNGEIIHDNLPKALTKEAFELAFDVFGTTANVYGIAFDAERDTYVYVAKKVDTGGDL